LRGQQLRSERGARNSFYAKKFRSANAAQADGS
jgi:hypothetical protein